jgi:hypothetical protein
VLGTCADGVAGNAEEVGLRASFAGSVIASEASSGACLIELTH